MLKMYFLQVWYGMSDEVTEMEIYDSYAFRTFTGIDFLSQQVPDKTTLCNFRNFLVENNLQKSIFEEINKLLDEQGLIMHGGTITDATIIHAAKSTKNEKHERDPEMASTKKGNNYHFGMKIHTGVDAGSGAVVSVTATAANAHDVTEAANNYRPDDDVRYGDAGYLGAENRPEVEEMDKKREEKLEKETGEKPQPVKYEINRRPSQRTEKPQNENSINWEQVIENLKSRARWKVEFPYHVVKNRFRCNFAIYKGLEKNLDRFRIAFASANLLLFSKRLAA